MGRSDAAGKPRDPRPCSHQCSPWCPLQARRLTATSILRPSGSFRNTRASGGLGRHPAGFCLVVIQSPVREGCLQPLSFLSPTAHGSCLLTLTTRAGCGIWLTCCLLGISSPLPQGFCLQVYS